jgi:hypothetical protein
MEHPSITAHKHSRKLHTHHPKVINHAKKHVEILGHLNKAFEAHGAHVSHPVHSHEYHMTAAQKAAVIEVEAAKLERSAVVLTNIARGLKAHAKATKHHHVRAAKHHAGKKVVVKRKVAVRPRKVMLRRVVHKK